MENIGDILARREKYYKAKSERAELIRQFMEELNAERDGKKYKKLSAGAVANILGHIKKKSDLYYFLSVCRDNKKRTGIFSKYFWWSLKPQSYPQQGSLTIE